MSQVVHKHEIPLRDDRVSLRLHMDAEVIHVAMQPGSPFATLCIWEEHAKPPIGSDQRFLLHQYAVYGTGHPIPESATHVGTALDGGLVWHLYELDQMAGDAQ